MKFFVEYFGQEKGADQTNFFERSLATWTPCVAPTGAPDFVSPSGSTYWYAKDGVIRLSDHWNGVASCRWTLKDCDTDKFDLPVAAFCAWSEFSRTVGIREEKEMPKGTKEFSKKYVDGKLFFVCEKAA